VAAGPRAGPPAGFVVKSIVTSEPLTLEAASTASGVAPWLGSPMATSFFITCDKPRLRLRCPRVMARLIVRSDNYLKRVIPISYVSHIVKQHVQNPEFNSSFKGVLNCSAMMPPPSSSTAGKAPHLEKPQHHAGYSSLLRRARPVLQLPLQRHSKCVFVIDLRIQRRKTAVLVSSSKRHIGSQVVIYLYSDVVARLRSHGL
jgi:hypothetical protein